MFLLFYLEGWEIRRLSSLYNLLFLFVLRFRNVVVVVFALLCPLLLSFFICFSSSKYINYNHVFFFFLLFSLLAICLNVKTLTTCIIHFVWPSFFCCCCCRSALILSSAFHLLFHQKNIYVYMIRYLCRKFVSHSLVVCVCISVLNLRQARDH